MPIEQGTVIKSTMVAYITPGITVPMLLGKDYHLTYKLTITHNIELETK